VDAPTGVGVLTQGPVLPVAAVLWYGWEGRLTSGRRNQTATSDTGRDEASCGEPDRRLDDRWEPDQLPERHREDAAKAGVPHDSVAPGV